MRKARIQTMAFISIKNISRTYGITESLKNVSLHIEQGEFAVLLGPSGSGKSTLLNLLGGMDRPTKGHIYVDGTNITKLNEKQLTDYRRTAVGFVFQFYNLIPSLNTYENINIAARIGKKPFDPKVIMNAVGLKNRSSHFPSELSGGELQRAAIARAIVKNPKLLLCDEPTGALDTETGTKILDLLYDMSRRFGKTVLVVTHNETITQIADRVIELKDGIVVTSSTAAPVAFATPPPQSAAFAPTPTSATFATPPPQPAAFAPTASSATFATPPTSFSSPPPQSTAFAPTASSATFAPTPAEAAPEKPPEAPPRRRQQRKPAPQRPEEPSTSSGTMPKNPKREIPHHTSQATTGMPSFINDPAPVKEPSSPSPNPSSILKRFSSWFFETP